jgi:hypothetical protein
MTAAGRIEVGERREQTGLLRIELGRRTVRSVSTIFARLTLRKDLLCRGDAPERPGNVEAAGPK